MRILLSGILAMAAVVIASNVLVQFLIVGGLLTWGAFTYPIAFLVTDLTNRLAGPAAARRVVLAGFAVGLICSLIGSRIEGEFGPLVPLRIAVASGTAFLVAQSLDVAVFDRLRAGTWWRAPLVSSVVGSAVDTALFFGIAFSAALTFGAGADAAVAWASDPTPLLLVGPAAPLWVTLALADWGVKMAVALVALIPFRAIVRRTAESPA